MKTGDKVLVYPHGEEKLRWKAHVFIISDNGRSIAIGFDHVPPFLKTRKGVLVHMTAGKITMLLSREALDGVPWGPWIDIFHGGHFEIEEIAK